MLGLDPNSTMDLNIDVNKDDTLQIEKESREYVILAQYDEKGEEIEKPDPVYYS